MDVARQPRLRLAGLPRIAAGALLLIAAGGTIAARPWRAAASASAPVVEKKTIWTDRVKRGDVVVQVAVHGTLVPEHVAWVSAPAAGRVATIAKRAGADVEAGDVVVVLENAELELAALEAERQAAAADTALVALDARTDAETKNADAALVGLRADLVDAQRHRTSADRLASEGLIGSIEHADTNSRARALDARVGVEEQRVDSLQIARTRQLAAQRAERERLHEIAAFAKKRVASLEVRAAVKGTLQDVPVENGQWVAIGAVLAKIAEPGRLKAEVRVAEGEAKDVRRGMPVRFEGAAGVTFRGRVDRIDPAVAKGTVKIDALLDDGVPPGARPDQSVTGYVEIDTVKNVLFAQRPSGARDDETLSVFRVEPDGVHAAKVTVHFGRGSVRDVAITSGLAEGDELVVSDVSLPPDQGSASVIRLR